MLAQKVNGNKNIKKLMHSHSSQPELDPMYPELHLHSFGETHSPRSPQEYLPKHVAK